MVSHQELTLAVSVASPSMSITATPSLRFFRGGRRGPHVRAVAFRCGWIAPCTGDALGRARSETETAEGSRPSHDREAVGPRW